jgi:hypothetical protein
LVISKEIHDISLPKTVTEFTQQVIELHRIAKKYYAPNDIITPSTQPSSFQQAETCTLKITNCPGATIEVAYPIKFRIQPNSIEKLQLHLSSTSQQTIVFDGKITTPDGWTLHSADRFHLECKNGSKQLFPISISYTSGDIRHSLQKLLLNAKVNGAPYLLELPLLPTMPWQVSSEPSQKSISQYHPRTNRPETCDAEIFESTGFWMPAQLKLEPNKSCRLQQSFLLEETRDIAIVVICNFDCLVWVDGSLIIKRGVEELFIPSFHRSSNKSLGVCKLTSGWHNWEILIHPTHLTKTADVLLHVGLGDLASQQWIRPKAWAAKAAGRYASADASQKMKDIMVTNAGVESAMD